MTTTTANTVDAPDFIELTPAKCVWCRSPLGLSYNGIAHEDNEDLVAWCSGSQKCRDNQLRWAIKEDLPNGVVHWLFLPTPKQVVCMEASERNLFVWGNRGGGKSVCFRWFCHAMALAKPGFKYMILRTKFPELEINHLNYLNDEMAKFGPENKSQYHKTSHTCFYPNGSIGYYRQCENDDDVKKVLGAEVDLLVFDEAPTFQWGHMRLIGGSVRKKKGRKHTVKVRYLGNPTGESIDELWSYFIDKDVITEDTDDEDDLCDPEYDPADWANIEMRLEDNPYLDYAEYRKQFSGIAKHIRKAWQDGVRAEERALFEFYPRKWDDYKGEMIPYHVVDELPTLADGTPIIEYDSEKGEYKKPSWVQVYRAYDHGFSPDPAVVLWFAIVGRMIICFKEQFWKRTIAENIAKECVEDSKGLDVIDTYCLPLDAPVWMGDFSFKPLTDVKVGDVVIGTCNKHKANKPAKHLRKGKGYRKSRFEDHLQRTKVTAIHRTRQEVTRITMESGRVIYCTPDHRWLSGVAYTKDNQHYIIPKIGSILVQVVDNPGQCPDYLKAAWLAGIYDGEGHRNYIAQSRTHNPEVYQRIIDTLSSLNFDAKPVYKEAEDGKYESGVRFNGGFDAAVKFSNWIPSTRFSKFADRYLLISKYKTKDKVAAIESCGYQDVGCITTESGDFIAYGYVTSNCDPSIDIKTGNSVYTTMQVFENNKMPMNPMKNDRALFCDVIHRILGEEIGPNQPRIVFYSRGCPQVIKYIPRMKWNENDPSKMAEHKHDHAPVALAYFAESHVPVTKPGESKKIKPWMIKKKKKNVLMNQRRGKYASRRN